MPPNVVNIEDENSTRRSLDAALVRIVWSDHLFFRQVVYL
jgi:hypothetical protein